MKIRTAINSSETNMSNSETTQRVVEHHMTDLTATSEGEGVMPQLDFLVCYTRM